MRPHPNKKSAIGYKTYRAHTKDDKRVGVKGGDESAMYDPQTHLSYYVPQKHKRGNRSYLTHHNRAKTHRDAAAG